MSGRRVVMILLSILNSSMEVLYNKNLSTIHAIPVAIYGHSIYYGQRFCVSVLVELFENWQSKRVLNQSRGSILRCSYVIEVLPLVYDLSNLLSDMLSQKVWAGLFTTMSDLHSDNLSFEPVKNHSYYYFCCALLAKLLVI